MKLASSICFLPAYLRSQESPQATTPSVKWQARSAQLNEPAEVELGPTSSEIDTTSGNPASTVKAKIQMVGGSDLPVPLRVAMRSSKGRVVSVRPVNADGEATFANISTGQYDFLAASANKEYSASIAAINGVRGGRKLDVSSGTSVEVTLSLVGGEVNVEGVAQKSGKPFAGAMVVLVPQDPDLRRESSFAADQSDMDGTFSLLQAFPGTYTVIAIENGWDLDWGKPEVLALYYQAGTIHHRRSGKGLDEADRAGRSTTQVAAGFPGRKSWVRCRSLLFSGFLQGRHAFLFLPRSPFPDT